MSKMRTVVRIAVVAALFAFYFGASVDSGKPATA